MPHHPEGRPGEAGNASAVILSVCRVETPTWTSRVQWRSYRFRVVGRLRRRYWEVHLVEPLDRLPDVPMSKREARALARALREAIVEHIGRPVARFPVSLIQGVYG